MKIRVECCRQLTAKEMILSENSKRMGKHTINEKPKN